MEKRLSIPENGSWEWAKLVLPWLSPPDLSSLSSTCKSLHQIAHTITSSRVSDASRTFEKHPIPFINTIDNQPYSYFIHSPFQILGSSQSSLAQPWGTEPISDSPSFSICDQKFESQTVETCSGCVCEKCSCEKFGDLGCSCWNLKDGFLGVGLEMGVMSECGSNCVCGFDCTNRSTQRGVGVRLKIVKDCRKGWCLHAAQFVGRGVFICEYAGAALSGGVPPYPLYKRLALALQSCIAAGSFRRLSDINMLFSEYKSLDLEEKEWSDLILDKGSGLENMLKAVEFELHVQEPFFSQLRFGEKTIEGRCAVGDYRR